MAATSHPLASLVAIEALRAAGNAVDAAVTAVAVLCVVEPQIGIGGDCFAMIAEPGKPLWGYNGSGRAGKRGSTGALLAQGIAPRGAIYCNAVTVPRPGAIEAWARDPQGARPLRTSTAVLMPAIRFAEEGFPVSARVAWDWQRMVAKLQADAGATRHYLFSVATHRRKATW